MTELSLKFPASWKTLLDTMCLQAEDGCPSGTEELWVYVQAARFLCHFQSFGSCLLPVDIGKLYPFGVFDGVEEWIVIVFFCYDKR